MNRAERDTSDLALIQRMADGDKSAVQTLFARHYTRVYRFTMRYVSSESIAEEVANEVFMDAWRGAARFQGNSKVHVWLMAIARNKAISRLRKRTEEPLSEEQARVIVDDQDSPEVTAQKTDKAGALRKAIEQLSSAHRRGHRHGLLS